MSSFAYGDGQYSEKDVRGILGGDWKFTRAQVEALNQTRAESLAAPIYEIISSAGIRLTKWENENEPLGAKAFHECRFVDLDHNGSYAAIAVIGDKRPYSYIIQKRQGRYRVVDVENWGGKLTYHTSQRDYVMGLVRLQDFCAACPNGYFPRIYEYREAQLVETSNQHPEFYAKDFSADVEILLSTYEGRRTSAIPPVTGEAMLTNWTKWGGYYDRVKTMVGLAHAMLNANRLFSSPVLPKQSFIRIRALLTVFSPANASSNARKQEAGMFRSSEEQIWENAKKSVENELLRYR